MSVFGKRVGEPVTGQGETGGLPDRDRPQEVGDHLERGPAVEIVGVYDHEGAVDGVAAGQHGLTRPPGPGPAGRGGEPWRQVVDRLDDVPGLDVPFDPSAYPLAEIRLDVPADDEDHPVETGLPGIVDRIMDDRFARRPGRFNLLQSAEPAADAGGGRPL